MNAITLATLDPYASSENTVIKRIPRSPAGTLLNVYICDIHNDCLSFRNPILLKPAWKNRESSKI